MTPEQMKKFEANLKELCRILAEDEEEYYMEQNERANRKVNIAMDEDTEEMLWA